MSIQDLMTASAIKRRRQLIDNLAQAYNQGADEQADLNGIEEVLNYINGCLTKRVARDKAQQTELEPHTVILWSGTIVGEQS